MSAPVISRRDAAALIAAKKNIDWLATVQAEARGRNLPVFAIRAREEIQLQRTRFWLIADAAGLGGLSPREIAAAARTLAERDA